MRLLTYNVHGCIGFHQQFRGRRVIDNIRKIDADFVALQEVYDTKAEDRAFLCELRDLGYECLHFGMTMRRDDGHYGNVVLLKATPDLTEEIDLSLPGKEPRGAIRMFFDWEGRPIEVVATHLGLDPQERGLQIDRLLEVLSDRMPTLDHPRILLGDLNEWNPLSRRAKVLRRHFEGGPRLRTFPSLLPLFALDRIFVEPVNLSVERLVLKGREYRSTSDHLPLLGELKW